MSVENLTQDMDIIQKLVIPGLDTDLDVIQKLDDEPNDVGGLSAAELKAKFDEAGNIIKTYINDSLLPAVSDTVAEAEVRAAAEEERQANEAGRVAAEEERKANENERVTAEARRAAAEAVRAGAEEKRVTAEAERVEAEAARKAAEAAREAASNPNLLDNWYFVDPIDQRQGYVVPPDTPYYSDTALTTQAGTVSGYTKAVKVNDTYGTITVSGATYYVAWSAAVRGHTTDQGSVPAFDCWRLAVVTVTAEDGCLHMMGETQYSQISQRTELNKSAFAGQTVTVSVLCRGNASTKRFILYDGGTYLQKHFVPASETEWELVSATGTLPETFSNTNPLAIHLYPSFVAAPDGDRMDVKAVKLELGSVQTLAHQDEDGNWVLNDPPPNKGLELLKCQRYYQLFSSADKRPTNLADHRPAMRVNPAVGTISINGQTLYYADANV